MQGPCICPHRQHSHETFRAQTYKGCCTCDMCYIWQLTSTVLSTATAV
jgi:hypothetical protein